jgi:hypothetical protein
MDGLDVAVVIVACGGGWSGDGVGKPPVGVDESYDKREASG